MKGFNVETKIDLTTLHVFLEHYKPFVKIVDGKGVNKKKGVAEQVKLDSVFPNVR